MDKIEDSSQLSESFHICEEIQNNKGNKVFPGYAFEKLKMVNTLYVIDPTGNVRFLPS